MDVNSILSLISDLYNQIISLQKSNEELKQKIKDMVSENSKLRDNK